MTITQIEQPSQVTAGERFTVTMDVEIKEDDDTGDPFFLTVGLLVPRSWAASESTTVWFESTVGNSTMRPTTPDEIDGTNYPEYQGEYQ